MEQKPRVVRRITIIKGSFQTPYVLLTVGFFGALTLMIFLDYSWFVQDSVLTNPTRPDLTELFAKASWTFYMRFILYILSLVFFLYVLFHRLAGPALRFKRLARSVAEGDLTQRVHLRNFDGLKDVQDDLNLMMDSLAGTIKKDRETIGTALKNLDGLKDQTLSLDARVRLDSARTSLSQVLKSFKL
ncbi:MAG: methyl-accepting chemotaxis protein [Elusimicrobia bacterium]|nr:methyl-accepting chemotaxis protein [Elusimicrobiota bacterium]